jgi:hypothetical protein
MVMPTARQYSSIFSNMREKECAVPVRDGLNRSSIFSNMREKEHAYPLRDGFNSKNHGQQPTTHRKYLPHSGT